MGYRNAFELLKAYYNRYYVLSNQGKFITLFQLLIHDSGFKYLIWFRLCSVGGIFFFFLTMYMHYSRKYHILLPHHTKVGPRLYLGHGMCIVVNPTATIGKNVSLSHFVNIGSNKGHAATIEDEVYIAPNVSVVEDVVIGRGATIGAGAVVTKDIPANAIAAGVPVRIIRMK